MPNGARLEPTREEAIPEAAIIDNQIRPVLTAVLDSFARDVHALIWVGDGDSIPANGPMPSRSELTPTTPTKDRSNLIGTPL
jgi:hypothetical protein